MLDARPCQSSVNQTPQELSTPTLGAIRGEAERVRPGVSETYEAAAEIIQVRDEDDVNSGGGPGRGRKVGRV